MQPVLGAGVQITSRGRMRRERSERQGREKISEISGLTMMPPRLLSEEDVRWKGADPGNVTLTGSDVERWRAGRDRHRHREEKVKAAEDKIIIGSNTISNMGMLCVTHDLNVKLLISRPLRERATSSNWCWPGPEWSQFLEQEFRPHEVSPISSHVGGN